METPETPTLPWINLIAKAAHENARRQGYYDDEDHPRHTPSVLALVVTEIAELIEVERKGKALEPCDKPIPLNYREEESADVILRMIDWMQSKGIDIHKAITVKHLYNLERATAKEQGKAY